MSNWDPSSMRSWVNFPDSPSIYLLDGKSVAEFFGTNLFTIFFSMVSYTEKKIIISCTPERRITDSDVDYRQK